MILGTHNTMSYRMPKHWYHWPIMWTARCQSVDYKKQHELYGVGFFDFRLFWDSKGELEFRHGIIAYDASDFWEILDYCEKEGIACRILFEERTYAKGDQKLTKKLGLKQRFKDICSTVETMHPNLKVFGGQNCGNFNEMVYEFKCPSYPFEDNYASTTSLVNLNAKWVIKLSKKLRWLPEFLKKMDDLCPFLYAKLKNRENFRKFDLTDQSNKILLFDFINIR